MRLPCCLALALLTTSISAAHGDGLLLQLPEDGTWAQYNYELTVKYDGKLELERGEGLIRVSSVGRETVDGQACRWIEIRLEAKPEDAELEKLILKLLIPEKHFKKGENPLEHVVRGWARSEEDEPPNEVKGAEDLGKSFPGFSGLAQPLDNARELAEMKVRGKLGELPCKGVAGTMEFRPEERAPPVQVSMEQRRHSKAPFGLVEVHGSLTVRRNGAVNMKMSFDGRLAGFGTGAKSEMPDLK